MKVYTLIIFLLLAKLSFCQVEIPNSITLKLFYGGDYRSELYGFGASDETDSLTFTFKKEADSYISEEIYQIRKVFPFINNDFINKNINKDSTITILNKTLISRKEIGDLINYLILNNYENYISEEDIFFQDGAKYSYQDTILIAKELELKHFDIERDEIIKECHCRNIRMESNFDCSKIDFNKLLQNVLNHNSKNKIVSSYIKYVSLFYMLNGKEYSITQKYPGELNIKWKVNIDGANSDSYSIVNPRINKVMNNLIPKRLKSNFRLIEYTEVSQWIERIE